MKISYAIILIVFLLATWLNAQHKTYWENATVAGSKIYTISFLDQHNGFAFFMDKEIFLTTDSGTTWEIDNRKNVLSKLDGDTNIWSADIYCSIMQSVDGGENWKPYSGERQVHFCKVYLKDPNVDYKIAADFLSKVTEDIFNKISNDRLDDIINHPVQCTEYFCNESEGWALGWCIRNFEGKIN